VTALGLPRFAFRAAISHALPVSDEVQRVIDDVLNPLLQKDASGIELLSVSEEEVVVRVSGRAAYGVGAEYVRTGIIEPALRKVVAKECAISIKKTIPTAKRRSTERE
jgi:Fe-S cluster biogenesis protein NfuA